MRGVAWGRSGGERREGRGLEGREEFFFFEIDFPLTHLHLTDRVFESK